jgi:2-C-methyl-D-erythritol 4-phosphate cytidylyltransferase
MEKQYVSALILAAGVGSRMCSETTKQKMEIRGKTVLERAIEIYQNSSLVDDITLVVKADELDFAKSVVTDYTKVKNVIIGGKVRAESAKLGFEAVCKTADFVAIHDAARCLTSTVDVDAVIKDAFIYGAATASTRVTDTVKEVGEDGFIMFTHSRKTMRFVQTPQVFSSELYKKALDSIDVFDDRITDDNFLLENISHPVFCTETNKDNIKITTPEDILYANFLLRGEENE